MEVAFLFEVWEEKKSRKITPVLLFKELCTETKSDLGRCSVLFIVVCSIQYVVRV